ncbi:GNAT family N-acetyltransferase [Kitasatospora sp. NPDC101801]|uniref:GNAT family N-acetyltransferase n=1 Tax=Kitasatospora sp. NPDC101801 TaxID=3364103 RepID=UPI00381C406D
MDDLLTERLTLHPFTPDEAERVAAGEPGPADHWAPGYPTEGERTGARMFLKGCQDGQDPHPFGNFEIRRRTDGAAIGGIGFHGGPDDTGAVEVGYGLAAAERGQGYATEAVLAVLAHARAAGARVFRAETTVENAASQGVLRKAGLALVRTDGDALHFELPLVGGE